MLVAACILLNNIGARLNGLLGLPFYIDNIGTILAALLGGYIPCITVGFFSNIFNAITSPDSIYYCVISVFIASLAAMYASKLRQFKIPYILLSVLTFAFLGGVVGGMLTWLIYGLDFGEGVAVDMAAAIDRAVSVGYLPSNLISCFVIDLADKAIAVVGEESDYLTEAKNLANYHHEKWNGKGYPAGLAGEDIPLSARVMAVADVFDALVSRRSYKEPFSVDEAFEIIRKDSGTHFDPLIVEAFFNAEDEIRRVQKLNLEL